MRSWPVICWLVLSAPARADVPVVPPDHPRVYVRPADIPDIQAKLDLPVFTDIWAEVQASDHPVPNAFVYLMTGDTTAGRQAIDDTLPALAACDDARVFENCMHAAAMVYDWCYVLLTPGEKTAFVTEFERIAASHSPGFPADPDAGAVVGHNTEGWLLTDQLPAGLAIYDEAPAMYDAAAVLFFDRFVPVRDYLYPAHMHHQGDSYIGTRFQHDQAASWLFRRLGAGDVVTNQQRYVPYQLVYNTRPDRQQMRSGDTYDDRGKSRGKRRLFLLTGAYYADPYLLEMAFWDHYWGSHEIDAVHALLFLPAGFERRPVAELPLTKYFPEPMGEMVARTGWEFDVGSSDTVVHMRIGATFFGNHQRKDFGTFQIYHQGPLAISSGVYEGDNSGYGSEHWRNYYHQTIAHNALLVFDPAEEMILHGEAYANDGGQMWPNGGADHPRHLETLLTEGYEVTRVIARQVGPDLDAPAYSYIAGDITGAYSPDKVNLVTRSMVTLITSDPIYPAALVVFDRVESADAAFGKTWLLHSIQEPIVSGRTISVERTGPTYDDAGTFGGKLTCASLLPAEASITKVGGPGREFWIESTQTNYATSKDGAAEPGAWRVEVSPATAAVSDRFLHALTVMDSTVADGPEAYLIEGVSHVGTRLLDRAVLFGREARLYDDAAFNLTGTGATHVLVCDLQAGTFRIVREGEILGTYDVTAEGTCLYFEGAPGAYTLEPGTLPEDGGTDAGPDAGVDAGPDAGVDAGPDAGADPGGDEAPSDAGADDGSDPGTHSGVSGSCGCQEQSGGQLILLGLLLLGVRRVFHSG